ncbi:acyl-CoA dehydrogenase family protein [Spirosoma sp.]|uniref:acyl-CoA dehydrogenase family protein n=1 Tax=Spirosoma sp. TaxID=1899569 RepID=UPI003B3A9EB5
MPSMLVESDKITGLLQKIAETASQTDDDKTFPKESFNWLANAGLLGITLTEPLGTDQLLQMLKQIGAANLAVGRVYEGHINALNLIDLYATSEQKGVWKADVIEHSRLFSVWNTQAADGVKIHVIGNGRYRLEGCKTFCSGANWIQRPLVTGELMGADRRGWQMCIIPTERVKAIPQDDQFWQPLGMRASVSYKLDFTGVELDESDLLGQPGDYYKQPYFSGGAIRFAAVQLGGAEALVEAVRAYLDSLKRTDDAFQRMRLAEMTWLVESGNHWLNAAGTKTDQWLNDRKETDKIVTYANMARTAIEEICLRVMPLAERSVGARGLMRPLPFERIHRDLTFYLRQPAPDATVLDIGRYVAESQVSVHELWR